MKIELENWEKKFWAFICFDLIIAYYVILTVQCGFGIAWYSVFGIAAYILGICLLFSVGE